MKWVLLIIVLIILWAPGVSIGCIIANAVGGRKTRNRRVEIYVDGNNQQQFYRVQQGAPYYVNNSYTDIPNGES